MDLLCKTTVVVPAGVGPGASFTATTAWGGAYDVLCPDSATEGDTVELSLPAGPETDLELLERLTGFMDDDESGFMRQIELFCLEHCAAIVEAARACSGETKEFSLHSTEVHAAYVALVEQLLEGHIAALGLEVEDFVGVVRRCGGADSGRGRQLVGAIDATTDFDVFLAMMEDVRRDGGLLNC